MWTSKFSKNQRNSHRQPFHSNQFEFTSLELYPRMRHTEFYRQTSIPEEYQSRCYEHPHNLDYEHPHSPIAAEKRRKDKIIPPKNSAMRVIRDSYFS